MKQQHNLLPKQQIPIEKTPLPVQRLLRGMSRKMGERRLAHTVPLLERAGQAIRASHEEGSKITSWRLDSATTVSYAATDNSERWIREQESAYGGTRVTIFERRIDGSFLYTEVNQLGETTSYDTALLTDAILSPHYVNRQLASFHLSIAPVLAMTSHSGCA